MAHVFFQGANTIAILRTNCVLCKNDQGPAHLVRRSLDSPIDPNP